MRFALFLAAMSSSVFAGETAAKRWDPAFMLKRLCQVYSMSEAEAILNAIGLNTSIYSFCDGSGNNAHGFASAYYISCSPYNEHGHYVPLGETERFRSPPATISISEGNSSQLDVETKLAFD